MKRLLLIGFLMCSGGLFAQDYLFYLHNRYLEEFSLTDEHPEYGRAEYQEIIAAFERNGFTVFSEKRKKDTDIKTYAKKIVQQIDSLLQTGVPADHITVLGTSKGGYIAQYVSTYLKNPGVNYVLIGCFMADDVKEWPDIQLCGNILSIYDVSDVYGVPMLQRIETSKQKITRFRELELTTGMKHGFLYKPLEDWIFPATQWGKRNYRWDDWQTQLKRNVSPGNFSGTILIGKGTDVLFDTVIGLPPADNPYLFWIASISKQFTAAVVLQEVEKGHIDLHAPIKNYFSGACPAWMDSVTVHHLLSHTHGIDGPTEERPEQWLKFIPGSSFSYSNYGFHLLSKIVAITAKQSFAELSKELFGHCGMQATYYPDLPGNPPVVTGHFGEREIDRSPSTYPAAGGFASSAPDLLIWNDCLHNGRVLKETTYQLMISPQPNAIRQHPVFCETFYGYGITRDTKHGILRLGQSGWVEGFSSLNFYYPETQLSLIVLCNKDISPNDVSASFKTHLQILDIVESSGLTCNLRYRITVDRQ